MTSRERIRDEERRALVRYLDGLRDLSRPVPCLDLGTAAAACFVSDYPEDQEYAASLCVGCAGRIACDAYGTTWPEEVGVYGGRTDLERRPRGRPAKRRCDDCNEDVANLPRHRRLAHEGAA